MAKELTANFSANSSGFSAAVQKLKTDLTNLNKSLDENKKAISETNKKTREYEKELELLKKAEKENGEATKEQKQRMGELETAIAQTRVKAAELKTEQAELKANIKSTTRQLEEQTVSANQSGKSLDAVKSSAKDLGKMLGTTAAGFSAIVGALYAMTASAGAAADDINTLSKQYGLSTEEIQKFKYATDLIDVSLETYVASIARNIRSMTAYQNGTEATVQAYDSLGVAVTDSNGKLRDSQTVYNEVISALGQVEDETERDSIAMTILGRNAQQLNPLILGGADALAELGEQAENLGLILPQESLDALNAFNDKVDTLKANMNGLQMVVGESFANSFDSFFEAGDDFLEFVQQLKADGTLDEMAKGLSDTLATLVNMLKTAIDIGWKFRSAIAAGAVALITFKTAINIGNIVSAAVTAIKSFKTATDAATIAQKLFNAAGAANPYVLIATLAATAVSGIITFISTTNNATQSVEELSQAASELSDEAQNSADKAKTLEEVLAKYEEASSNMQTAAEKTETLKTLQEQLNTAYGNTSQAIDLVNGSYDENIKKIKEATEAEKENARIKAQAAVNADNEAQRKLSSDGFLISTNSESYNEDLNRWQEYVYGTGNAFAYQKDIEIFGNPVYGHRDDNNIGLSIGGNTYKQRADALLTILERMKADGRETDHMYTVLAQKYEYYSNLAKEAADHEKLLAFAMGETAIAADNESDSIDDDSDSKGRNSSATQNLSEATSDLVKSLDEVASAYAEQEKNGSLSYDTMLKLIDAGYAQCISLDTETGKIKLNAEAYKELAQAKLAAQIAEYDTMLNETPRINSQSDYENWKSKNADTKLKRDALQSMYDNFDNFFESGSFSNPYSSSGSSNSSSDNIYSQAAAAYKTEADKKIDLIKRELEAKKELRDETIKAIDDEIEARKRLNEDNSMEKQINEVKAQLKYGQLDEFSREQLEKKLQGLYDQKAETEWQRNAQARKDAANARYDTQQKTYNAQIDSINQSLQTVQQIMSAMSDGSKSVESVINNNSTKNSTANVNIIGQAFTLAQLTKAIKDALMDDIVIR